MKKYDENELINMILNHPVRFYFLPTCAIDWSEVKKAYYKFIKNFLSFIGDCSLFFSSLFDLFCFILSFMLYPITRLIILIRTRNKIIKLVQRVDYQGHI